MQLMPVREYDHAQGPADAPVTLIKYGDYECSRSGQAHRIVKEIQQQLGEQLRFVFRHFPLTMLRPFAHHAAEAAEAASTQGWFWEMHDYLFAHQQMLGDGLLLQYAANLGLNVEQFEREIAEHVYANRIREDMSSGMSSGVNGTPTFFINGVRHNGTCDLASLLAAIADVVDNNSTTKRSTDK